MVLGEMLLFDTLLVEFIGLAIICSCFLHCLQGLGVMISGWLTNRTHTHNKPHAWWLHQVLCLLHHVVVGFVATYALLFDPFCYRVLSGVMSGSHQGAKDLNFGRSAYCVALLPLTLGYMIFDLIELIRCGQVNMLIGVHHVTALLLWPILLHYGTGEMWILYFLSTELTGPFNVIRKMLSEINVKESKVYLINGILFTVLFVAWRMVPIPWLCNALIQAHPFNPSYVPESYSITQLFWARVAAVFSVVPLLFNMYWGLLVVRGATRIFLNKPPANGKQSKQD
ncbi:hypothetical protein AAMO2058_001368700 [Amorphochlora amoebiformis]|uniref:TLC domain-containing protein n=1 Tax=Amorphochlora amoebiformis TaxID=1561963 RepID=A0A7S0DSG2_9EUKA|mmetsp:Transcript_8351/g.13059  ORF Transcript_8351/g.13059 Transcript_8351/m.13059 type:complete len:283 (+) Transcript_8351:54-902(+)